MNISMIAALGRKNEIGKGNDLVFHFHNDMVFFRETTSGGTVVMGRKTFDSLPKVLPKRRNIVISTNKNLEIEGAEVCSSIEEAIKLFEKDEKVFIIGGGRIYSEFLPYADKLYLTEVDAECTDADVFFPQFDKSEWSREVLAEHNEDGIDYQHILYTKNG